jgi:hypothetical protein
MLFNLLNILRVGLLLILQIKPLLSLYMNSYVAPAYMASGQIGGGLAWERTNQFSSAVSQPSGPAFRYLPTSPSLAMVQEGRGVVDTIKKVHGFIKGHKIVSRGLHLGAKFRPGLKKYADAAESIGYGKFNFEQPIGIVPRPLIGDSARKFRTMPMGPQKPRQM